MGFTFYANRFDTDDLLYRLLIFVAMLGVAALATTLPAAFAGASRGFVLSYVFVRVVLLVLYARAIRHVERGAGDRDLLLPRLLGSRGRLARIAPLRGAGAVLGLGARPCDRARRADRRLAADPERAGRSDALARSGSDC